MSASMMSTTNFACLWEALVPLWFHKIFHMPSDSEDSLLEDPTASMKEILSTPWNNCGSILVPTPAGLFLSPPNEPGYLAVSTEERPQDNLLAVKVSTFFNFSTSLFFSRSIVYFTFLHIMYTVGRTCSHPFSGTPTEVCERLILLCFAGGTSSPTSRSIANKCSILKLEVE